MAGRQSQQALRDQRLMMEALRLARRGLGRTSPNPPVGALVVRGDEILGRGYHHRAGEPHAEVLALRQAGERARDAELFVTLEPCDHQGRTPPCTRAIIASGIRRVVVGTQDPNPQVSGRGLRRLRDAGIEVVSGVAEGRCIRVIEGFARRITEGRCHVTSKIAMSIDGRIATKTGHSSWISGPKFLAEAHRLRDQCDAVLVGAGTVRTDDPRLTCRRRGGRDPMRVVLSGSLDLPADARLFRRSDDGVPRVVVATTDEVAQSRVAAVEGLGAEVWRLPGRNGKVDLDALTRKLGEEDVLRLLVEGGASVHGAFWDARLVDRLIVAVAPRVIGGQDAKPAIGGLGAENMQDARDLDEVEVRRFGRDVVIQGVPRWDDAE